MRKRKQEVYRNGNFVLGDRGGEAVADYRNEDDRRRRARLGVPFATRGAAFETAKKKLDEFAESQRLVAAQQASHTCGSLWRDWLKEREADGLSNAVYDANWKSLGPAFENRYPMLLKTQDYRDYAKARFALGRAPWTVNTELVRLRACLKWAWEQRHLPARPKVWVPTPGEHRDRVLSVAEARDLVAGARRGDPHVYLFVMIAFATGARHMAILDLTWDRINFETGIIEFDEDLPPDPMSKAWRKGRATVPMNQSVRAALLEAHAGRQTDHVIEHGGKRLTTGVEDGFRNAVERAGLGRWVPNPTPGRPKDQKFETDVTPHTIRHTVSTWLEGKKVDDNRRAQLLGHADPKTTRKVYTHSGAELLNDAVELLEFAPLPKITHSEIKSDVEDAEVVEVLSQRDIKRARRRPKNGPRKT